MTTVLIWTAYLLTVTAAHQRLATWRPHWEMRAELAAMAAGLIVLAAIIAYAAPALPPAGTWVPKTAPVSWVA